MGDPNTRRFLLFGHEMGYNSIAGSEAGNRNEEFDKNLIRILRKVHENFRAECMHWRYLVHEILIKFQF